MSLSYPISPTVCCLALDRGRKKSPIYLLVRLLGRTHLVLGLFGWLPPLIARIVVGWVFVQSGWGKIHHLDKVTAFFTDLGLPIAGRKFKNKG